MIGALVLIARATFVTICFRSLPAKDESFTQTVSSTKQKGGD
jgi:Cft2 family RNA processing exonuclease